MSSAPLPQILAEVAEIAGLDAALRLAQARGGRRLYVPQKPTPDFVAEIGEPAALALSKLYANETISVPLGPTGAVKQAKRAVHEALARGLSAGDAARVAGVTERTVYNHRARRRAEQDSRQGRLFDD
jgi:DNA-binding NarL/FixJ family response regulator